MTIPSLPRALTTLLLGVLLASTLAGCSEEECPPTEGAMCAASCDAPSDVVSFQCVDGEWKCPDDHPVPMSVVGKCCSMASGTEIAPTCSNGILSCPSATFEAFQCTCSPTEPCGTTDGIISLFCDYPDNDCGENGPGRCSMHPPMLAPDAVGVCSCDGTIHLSPTAAANEGLDIAPATTCAHHVTYEPCGPYFCYVPLTRCEQLVSGDPDKGYACLSNACISNADCAEDQFCERAPGDLDCTFEGLCKPMPTSCDPLPAPVCGCDGKVYSNTCEAALEKQGTQLVTACQTPAGYFPCGDVFCAKGTYCSGQGSGTFDYPIEYACIPLPAACTEGGATPSCACIEDDVCAPACMQSADGDLSLVCTL
ncbi:hypothetical protein [Polyangium aurulentum]|uniref:hypothetical protein n=1 Tax=Polyangium aurulentum TaxID=2567896 RepID=UPI0010ADB817|nr:hypothetical protein [Polyangium aurulentum]UQA62979.1 hypothetical protein E8A73_021980 [Polyangium aurulentum]